MDVVILCGGRGTRLQEHSRSIPKPLVEIGGRPILWHVMGLYAAQGHRRFILCTGYRHELIAASQWPAGVEVECVDTGLDTPTGARLHRVRDRLAGRFHLTYADGLADIDLAALERFHAAHGDPATMTVVRPELPFGVTRLDGGDGLVTGFREKPRSEHWVNGGFFVFEPAALDYMAEGLVLEREPLEGLAADRRLHAFRHQGFWDCMDTYKDAVLLNDLWAAGAAPWRTWDTPARR